jgi:hypothetical protein
MKIKNIILIAFTFIIVFSCKKSIPKNRNTIKSLQFIGEQILPDTLIYKNTKVGGLSSIDYANGKYYLISDDKEKPIRFYEMDLSFNSNSFSKAEITNVITIKNDTEIVDPEALRFDRSSGNFLWTSEGSVFLSPSVFEITANGNFVKEYSLPKMFKKDSLNKNGLRKNGTFEGLSVTKNNLWIGMELPLKQDGEEPKLAKGKYPVRISKIDKKTSELKYQFAYMLDAIPRDSKPSGKFTVNGLPEILNISENQFLFIERAYASGHNDGGNDVKIYQVNCITATDISKIKSLKKTNYIPAKKTLLLDFETIRSKLTNGTVDNIEGITFGKTLKNGNRTLIVVSDNNFNKFSKQLNQIIVFEVIE